MKRARRYPDELHADAVGEVLGRGFRFRLGRERDMPWQSFRPRLLHAVALAFRCGWPCLPPCQHHDTRERHHAQQQHQRHHRLEFGQQHGFHDSFRECGDLGRDRAGSERLAGCDQGDPLDNGRHRRGRRTSRSRVVGQCCRQCTGRQRHAVAGQAAGQFHPGRSQPAGQRAFGNPQLAGGVLAGLALQIAQEDGRTVFFRQPEQFPVEDRFQVMPGFLRPSFRFGHVAHLPFPQVPFPG